MQMLNALTLLAWFVCSTWRHGTSPLRPTSSSLAAFASPKSAVMFYICHIIKFVGYAKKPKRNRNRNRNPKCRHGWWQRNRIIDFHLLRWIPVIRSLAPFSVFYSVLAAVCAQTHANKQTAQTGGGKKNKRKRKKLALSCVLGVCVWA